jgi:hypothetical protein
VREEFTPNQVINGVPAFTLSQPYYAGGKVGLQPVIDFPLDLRANKWGYDQQWNLTLERELPYRIAVRTSYVGAKGTNWPYSRDVQIPPPSTIPFTPERRPYGPDRFSSIIVADLGGNSTYHGMELEATRQFSSGLYIRSWYNWAKSLNDVQGGLFGEVTGVSAQNPYDRAADKGFQQGSIPHSARIMASYDLPFGRGQRYLKEGILNQVLGGWQINPLLTWAGAPRWTPNFSGVDTANVGIAGGRPDVIAGCDPNAELAPDIINNRACFAIPPNGRFGNAQRGILKGTRTWNTFLSVFKQWNLTPLENGPYFKLEMYINNVFNHSNNYLGALNVQSGVFGNIYPIASDTRSIYFRLRLGF